ncbi:MAG TPA: YebC/PmpR family DNA-binding transcriptional regulator [Candidatus Paceibacterota bacterium]|nr:YebC/PmpR family DNA-binding transcriptional regulator [Candidatus Paceibacterota bacterium]
MRVVGISDYRTVVPLWISDMSGHSKWSQIKHKKAASDARKSAAFGKLSRAISVAARDNPDPATNVRLKNEIDRARAANMPIDGIERAIRRVADKRAATLTEIQLEFIGPGGVAIVASGITDSTNRTINEVRQIATHAGVRMVERGGASWAFRRTPDGMEPIAPVTLEPTDRQHLESFLESLDEHEDIQDIWTNADL